MTGISFSTEHEAIQRRLAATDLFLLGLVLASIALLFEVAPKERLSILAAALLFTTILGIVMWSSWKGRGTWTITADRLEFCSRHGRTRRLDWNEVDHIIWGKEKTVFVGKRESVVIPWHMLKFDPRTPRHCGELRAWLETHFAEKKPDKASRKRKAHAAVVLVCLVNPTIIFFSFGRLPEPLWVALGFLETILLSWTAYAVIRHDRRLRLYPRMKAPMNPDTSHG